MQGRGPVGRFLPGRDRRLEDELVEAGCGAARAHERLHAAIAIWKRAER